MSFSSTHLYYDDLEVGKTYVSASRTVTEADIVNFAGVSGDFNPIHVDHHFARTTAFRKPIAHGLLVFSIASGLCVSAPQTRILALTQISDWAFKLPVFAGDTVRMVSVVAEIIPRSRNRRAEVRWNRQIVNHEDKVVQEGRFVTLVEGRAAQARLGEREPG